MPFTTRMHGKSVGILGLGRIGQEIAGRCAAFKMPVSYHTRSPRDVPYIYYTDLVAMARDCDFLIAILPGGPETKHIVNREVLDAIGPEGVFVNVARGSVVDEAALIAALQDGTLGAAGLDVFANEPVVLQALKDMTERVVLQPHQASATHDTRLAMGRMVIENLRAGIEGRPTGTGQLNSDGGGIPVIDRRVTGRTLHDQPALLELSILVRRFLFAGGAVVIPGPGRERIAR